MQEVSIKQSFRLAKILLGLKKESILADKAEKRMKAGKNIEPPGKFSGG